MRRRWRASSSEVPKRDLALPGHVLGPLQEPVVDVHGRAHGDESSITVGASRASPEDSGSLRRLLRWLAPVTEPNPDLVETVAQWDVLDLEEGLLAHQEAELRETVVSGVEARMLVDDMPAHGREPGPPVVGGRRLDRGRDDRPDGGHRKHLLRGIGRDD